MERSDFVRDGAGFEKPDIHSSSPEYAGRFSGAAGRWFLEVQEQATSALLSDLTFSSVVDVGGGHCQNLPLLRPYCQEVTVIGSDAVCPELLRPFLQDGRVVFKSAPLVQTGLAEMSFEVVLSYRMLTHLHDWKALVAELCRLAKTTVLVEFPVRVGFNKLSNQFFSIKKGVEGNTRPYTLFDEKEICREFHSHRFRLHSRRSQFFWPMALHRLHGSAWCGQLLESLPAATGLTVRLGSPVIARFDREEC